MQKFRRGLRSRGAAGLPFSPRARKGGLCTESASRAKCRKRAEATWEPAGWWPWRQLVVRARYEPRLVSCLQCPALYLRVAGAQGDWRLWP